ncbi:hypothetical protein C8R45DRAFT_175299 [Mycena sanguinolenta]|nr:hypothetical protein C8R45DRAFT_175299 [Mycena sanguinolenta]
MHVPSPFQHRLILTSAPCPSACAPPQPGSSLSSSATRQAPVTNYTRPSMAERDGANELAGCVPRMSGDGPLGVLANASLDWEKGVCVAKADGKVVVDDEHRRRLCVPTHTWSRSERMHYSQASPRVGARLAHSMTHHAQGPRRASAAGVGA